MIDSLFQRQCSMNQDPNDLGWPEQTEPEVTVLEVGGRRPVGEYSRHPCARVSGRRADWGELDSCRCRSPQELRRYLDRRNEEDDDPFWDGPVLRKPTTLRLL